MNTEIITFTPDGTRQCLWTEAVPLGALGRLSLQRASTIEFNQSMQLWEVRLVSAPDIVAYAHPSREHCLQWERRILHAVF